MKERWLHIDVDSLFVKTVQEFFDDFIPSKKMQHLLIQNKWILLDGNPVKREDDIVGLKLQLNIYPDDHVYEKNGLKCDICYEDEIMVAVNKPKDLIVHSDGSDEMSLTRMLESYYADRSYVDCLPLHRLDKQTGGLVLFSKSGVFQPLLDRYMSEKTIRRNYLAFVEGRMEVGKIFTIDKPIGKDRHDAKKRIVHKDGQKAITKVRVVACNKARNYSVLLCTLDTGRTHQIRVHLASEGYPIINDDLYGSSASLCKRMGLFAESIELYHPLKEDSMTIEAQLPSDLEMLYLEALR